ncbi:hypothetical protein HYC85_032261, partial [Camellia sinensis]
DITIHDPEVQVRHQPPPSTTTTPLPTVFSVTGASDIALRWGFDSPERHRKKNGAPLPSLDLATVPYGGESRSGEEAMAGRSSTKHKPIHRSGTSVHKLFKNPNVGFAFALLFIDALLVALIIAYVPYTKIDWDAYMSQVSGFLEGEKDYRNLKGDTGPLVYPAGFLYVYSAIQFVTGGQVLPAQILFGILYILNLGIVLYIYVKTDVLPWWALSLLCLSKRVHSIFVLRLFNDCFATTLFHAALALLLNQKWHLGLIIFRSVNFKFVPEPVFVSKEFAVSLLITHLILLAVFAHYRWCKHEGGLLNFLHLRFVPVKLRVVDSQSTIKLLNKEHIVTTLFVGNFIGIICARSLHFQFYSWYFYSLPYLLWKTSFPTLLRLMLFVVVEFCWNVFPLNDYSSALLLCVHLIILWGLWTAPAEYPYVDSKPLTKSKRK